MTARVWSLATGSACLVAAVLLSLLADDVRRWRAAVPAGDMQVRVAPERADAWRAPGRLPFRVAERLLGIGDDLEYRRAARLFLLARSPADSPATTTAGLAGTPLHRARARLRAIERSEADRWYRSAAANLAGVLAYESGEYGSTAFIRRSLRTFQDAVRIDPSNEQAKFNLELLLERTVVPPTPAGRSGRGRERSEATGAGSTAPGKGY